MEKMTSKTGRHLFLQCFKFGKAMYIIRNKIRVTCSKIRVGMGGSIFPRGVHISQGNMDPGSIFRGGGHIQYDTGREKSFLLVLDC